MAGVRIVHPTERSRLVVIVDIARPLQDPTACLRCNTMHTHKSYHLDLDDTGAAIVAVPVFRALQKAGAIPGMFEVSGEVKNPPGLTLTAGKTRPELDFENRKQIVYGKGAA